MKVFKHALQTVCLSGLALAGMSLLAAGVADAQTPPPLDAAQSDPKAMGWMQGFPPAPDKLVRFGDGSSSRFPQSRWAFSHIRELVPTATVGRGDGPVATLPRAERDLGAIALTTMDGKATTFNEALALTYTDGILVLHKGQVIYEKYFGEGATQRPHLAFSVTKSFVGTLAAMLAAQGKLDPAAPVTQYVPELKASAYGDATVRQVMDMTIGVKYSENYADPKAEVFDYARAGGMIPFGPNYQGPRSFFEFLVKLDKEGEHDNGFAYKTSNAEVLAWIVKRASGQSMAELLSSQIWSKLGMESDAYFMVDSIGTESGGGGLNTTLRDLARFGEMMRNRGRANGQQVLPEAAVAEIAAGGDKAKFATAGYKLLPGWSYKDMWWVTHNAHNAYMARGIYGQNIYVDPTAEMVIVRYASHPVAANAGNDPVTLPAYMAVAKELMK
ncbi:MAG: 6-aminohexanoate-dimer hydrolase [Tardiphaga sp.]|jgi:CubicO group peptidase (beta-lactamase class C family)|nr:6-aminohexanoate-dimer hydrolase [Tardiphaga sp.]MDB5628121.1 6-aminohexanoate-dimer hydrolase [Tardiphaga sp.]